ncbi:diguanylate cyclase (GGDEF)-like protein [Kibdelosporangium banguiense]|uniref:Diguanylate cyclase (GGDEF)-like protein n=1 Tax=Kibdelosporangium banguiense TaxID=1365924 RepID=A0ABS4T718_9PSEU|nr:GGDEF domain-containing protein [Kibdelosporangium banguiense]MBP2320212.1 diguanylate cyclase (GGDEF)-like protein [Kibdelosporangium banguiense]
MTRDRETGLVKSVNPRLNWVSPSKWRLWSLPRAALAYVLVTDLAAALVTVIAGLHSTVSGKEWVWFAVLTVASILHLEAARSIERRRELAVEGVPYTNLKSLWVFTGVLLLPLPLVVGLAVIAYTYCWLRVYGEFVWHRKIFSAATFILASAAASAVLRAGGLAAAPRVPVDFLSLVVVVSAAATWWLVNYAMVVGAILLSNPETNARAALGDLSEQLVVAAALGLGIAVGALEASNPWVVPVLMVTVLALHRDLLLPQYQRAARTDDKTGLAAPTFWSQVVGAELRRAQLVGGNVGILMMDVDNFSEINNKYGHPAGDQALQSVVRVVRSEIRRGDLAARWGGDELAVLLPGTTPSELAMVGERIRLRLAHTPVTITHAKTAKSLVLDGITVSMGAAVYPDSGVDVDRLVLAADAALLAAKEAGRNQIRLATPCAPVEETGDPEVPPAIPFQTRPARRRTDIPS